MLRMGGSSQGPVGSARASSYSNYEERRKKNEPHSTNVRFTIVKDVGAM